MMSAEEMAMITPQTNLLILNKLPNYTVVSAQACIM